MLGYLVMEVRLGTILCQQSELWWSYARLLGDGSETRNNGMVPVLWWSYARLLDD